MCILPHYVGTDIPDRGGCIQVTGAVGVLSGSGSSDVPPARRRLRVSRGHVLMVVAGLVGVVLSFAVLREREGTTSVLVATHEIRAGERIAVADFRRVRVTLDADVLNTVVHADELVRMRGRI